MKIFLIYLLLMNIAGFAAMGIDKCKAKAHAWRCLLYTSPSPRDLSTSRMPSSA